MEFSVLQSLLAIYLGSRLKFKRRDIYLCFGLLWIFRNIFILGLVVDKNI